jgi:hypothetical protein
VGTGRGKGLIYKMRELTAARHCWLTPVILASWVVTWESEIGRIRVRGQPGKTVHETPISKITREKWTRYVTQAVEHLLCKHKALSSNSSPTCSPKKELTDYEGKRR